MGTPSAPTGLITFILKHPRLKLGLSSRGPSGRNRLQIRQAPRLSWNAASASAKAMADRSLLKTRIIHRNILRDQSTLNQTRWP